MITWFGHLPGDIHIKTDWSEIFIPVTSMIIVSSVIFPFPHLIDHAKTADTQ